MVSASRGLGSTVSVEDDLLHAQAGVIMEGSQGIVLAHIEQYSQPDRMCLTSFVSHTDSVPKTGACGIQLPSCRHTTTCWLVYDSADTAKCSDSALDSMLRTFGSTLLGFVDLVVPAGSEDVGIDSAASDALGLEHNKTGVDSDNEGLNLSNTHKVDAVECAVEKLRKHMFDACSRDAPTMCELLCPTTNLICIV
jgi:hypothetical protein